MFGFDEQIPTQEVPQESPVPMVQQENIPSSDTAIKRATDASFGMSGTLGISLQDYHDAFMSGQEQTLRKYSASVIDQKFDEERRQNLVEQIKQKPISQLNPEDMEALTTPTRKTDPSSVFEGEWARRYMNHLNWPLVDDSINWVKSVVFKHPELYDAGINIGTEATARIKWIQTLHQNNEDGLSTQGYAGWLWDQAKNLTTVKPLWFRYFKLPSENVLNEPFDDAWRKKINDLNNSLNPSDRVAFTQFLLGESTDEKFVNTISPILQPGVEVSAIAGALGVFRNAPKITTTRTPRLMSGVEMSNIRQGFKDVEAGQIGQFTGEPRGMTPDELVRAGGSRMLTPEETESIRTNLGPPPTPGGMGSTTEDAMASAKLEALAATRAAPPRDITPEELKQFQGAIRNMIKNVVSEQPPEVAAPLAAGNLDEAVSRSAIRNLAKKLTRRGDPARDALGYLQNVFKVLKSELKENPGNNGAAGIRELEDSYDTLSRSLPEMIMNIARVEKAPVLTEAMPEAISAVKQEVKDQHKSISNSILDVSVPYREPISNAWFADLRVGKNSTEYFKNEGTAHATAKRIGLDGYEVKQEGAGFYISKPIPIDINTSGMRSYFAKLPTNQSPFSTVNAFMGRLRTPNETLSTWQIRNRSVVDHAPSVLLDYMARELDEVQKLASWTFKGTNRRGMWDDFERVLDNARSIKNPDTGTPGYTFKNPGELQFHYMKWIGRLPTDVEEKAYFAWKRTNELDHALRVVSIVNHKQTNGVMAHRFSWMVNGEKIYSPEFEATPVSKFPGGSSHTMVILGDQPGAERITQVSRLGSDLKKWEDKVNKGEVQMARIWAPEYSPLAGYGDIKDSHHVLWVISPNGFETKPIDWTKQLPRQGGGHFVYDATHWISQPNLRIENTKGKTRIIYLGDNKYMPFSVQKLGSDVMGHLNKAFEHIQLNKMDDARNIIENTLKMDWNEFKGNFESGAGRNPITGQFQRAKSARFNKIEPFQLIESNKRSNVNEMERRVKELYPQAEFVDGTRSGSRNKQFQIEFQQERDASDIFTINDVGSAGNPVYKQDKAKLLDAIPTMDRAMTKLSNSFMMDDYKNFSVNHWLAENKKYLNVSEGELNSSPLYWFQHAEYHPEADKTLTYQAETQRMQIKQFIGQVSDTDNLLHGMTQKLVNSIYERMGQKAAEALDPPWLLSTLKDPSRFIRSMTFHLKMGLFSVPQLLVQSNTYVNILGIAGPVRATQGTAAALMHLWSRVNANPAIIAALDRKLSAFGWKPGEFTEARQAYLSSGFGNIGREYGMLDDLMSNRVISRGWQKFLDWGTMPFKAGESSVRAGAWYTAYKEFRDVNPTGKITNADLLTIKERAVLLNANMSRSSNNLYQKGWTSLPLQFLTYSIRQAELMWGHRLTPMEKARLLGVNSLVFGLPIGLSVSGLPMEAFMRDNALQNGYVPSTSNYIESMITEGVPSTLLALINGGKYYNISEKFGGSGITNISEAFRSDKTIFDILGGASFSTMKNLLDSGDSFARAMISGISGDHSNFDVTMQHIAQIGKEATSFNSGWRLVEALKSGEWMSKNERFLQRDINPLEAVMMTLTGTQTLAASDVFKTEGIMQQEKELAKWAENRFTQEFRRALKAYENGDPDNGLSFMTLAFSYMEKYIPEEQRTQVLADASKTWESTIEKVRDQFYTRNVPPSLEQIRQEAYIKLMKQGQ